MKKRVIGLMTGTSVDGIDLAIAEFEESGLTQVFTGSYALSPALKQQLHELCLPGFNDLEQSHQVAISYTKELARAVNAALVAASLTPDDIDAIGNHGQTIRHCPEHGFSVQLADNQRLALLTGIPVVGDFRQKDLALGGQGAPLAPAFHHWALASADKHLAVLNLGGIANISYLPGQDKDNVVGFDTGPANTLLDSWYRQHHDGDYDKGGHWAASGNVLPELLSKMLQDPYFALPWPKSTGRERFNANWLNQFELTPFAPEDVQATLAQLTVDSVKSHIDRLPQVHTIVLCGGGAHNTDLIKRLTMANQKINILSSQEFGIHEDDMEALLFAWLAYCYLTEKTSNLINVTGAVRQTVLGYMVKP